MSAIKNWYQNLSNSTRAGLATLFFTFIATLGLQVVGFLSEIQNYLNNGGPKPQLDTFGKVVLSGIIALAAGVVNWAVRAIQAKNNPASVPQYPKS